MADLESTARMRQMGREANEKLYSREKAQETEARIRSIQSKDTIDNRKPVEMAESTVSTSSLDKASRKRQLSKRQALDKTLQILSANPTTNASEIADQIGKSRQTVYDYFEELETAGKLRRSGNGIQVVD